MRPRWQSLGERLAPVQEGLNGCVLWSRIYSTSPVYRGKNQAALQPVDFQQIVQAAIGESYPLAEAKSLDLGMLRNKPATLLDVASNLSILVRNALENAIRCFRRRSGGC